jgi:hypothetical protein
LKAELGWEFLSKGTWRNLGWCKIVIFAQWQWEGVLGELGRWFLKLGTRILSFATKRVQPG